MNRNIGTFILVLKDRVQGFKVQWRSETERDNIVLELGGISAKNKDDAIVRAAKLMGTRERVVPEVIASDMGVLIDEAPCHD